MNFTNSIYLLLLFLELIFISSNGQTILLNDPTNTSNPSSPPLTILSLKDNHSQQHLPQFLQSIAAPSIYNQHFETLFGSLFKINLLGNQTSSKSLNNLNALRNSNIDRIIQVYQTRQPQFIANLYRQNVWNVIPSTFLGYLGMRQIYSLTQGQRKDMPNILFNGTDQQIKSSLTYLAEQKKVLVGLTTELAIEGSLRVNTTLSVRADSITLIKNVLKQALAANPSIGQKISDQFVIEYTLTDLFPNRTILFSSLTNISDVAVSTNLTVWDEHFQELYGNLFDTKILQDESRLKALNTLKKTRQLNQKSIRSFLSEKNSDILKEFDEINAWNSIPATYLPFLALSQIYKLIESERKKFSDVIISNDSDIISKGLKNFVQLKRLITSLGSELNQEISLRQSTTLSIREDNFGIVRNIIVGALDKNPQLKNIIPRDFIFEYGVSDLFA